MLVVLFGGGALRHIASWGCSSASYARRAVTARNTLTRARVLRFAHGCCSYYRDLIRFRNTGDPALMLRSINPREASLVDRASGLRVRFRLGGNSFPPQIYYKIFTRAPLCDLGAFAPRVRACA